MVEVFLMNGGKTLLAALHHLASVKLVQHSEVISGKTKQVQIEHYQSADHFQNLNVLRHIFCKYS